MDFGCGSLRLGRLLLPFLQSRSYFAIDPNRWLIEDGISRQLGHDIIGLKLPSFSFNADFRCDPFGCEFDFIVAQSIITYCGPDLAETLLKSAKDCLAPGGRFLFSIIKSDGYSDKPAARGWVYPDCVAYGSVEIKLMCRRAGLYCREIQWFHPGATWFVAAREPEALPAVADQWLLRGAVLFDPQFEASRAR